MTLCVVALIASEFMPVSLLSPIAQDLGLSEGQAGQAISISGLFAVITSLSLRRVAGGIDRRYVLTVMTALLALSGMIVAWSPNYATLMVGRCLLGVAIGGYWSLSFAVTMRILPAASVPLGLSVIHSGAAFATTVSAPLGSYLAALIGWRWTFFAVVPIAAVAAAALWATMPPVPPRKSRPGGSWRLLAYRPVLLGFAAVLLLFLGQFALFTYLRPFLERVTHVNIATLSGLLLVVGLAGLVGSGVISVIVKLGLNRILLGMPLVLASVAVVLVLFGGNVWVVAVALAVWGMASAPAPVFWTLWLTQQRPQDSEAIGGLMVAFIQTAITLGAAVGGLVLDWQGPYANAMAAAVVLALAAGVAWVASRSVTARA